MHVLDETDLLLDLLREAGDEPVTLDELHVVGVRDPAQALLALELAGHSVHRVYERPRPGRDITCVRLGAPAPPAVSEPSPVAAPTPSAAAAAPARAAGRRGLLTGVALGALLLVLLAVLRRDR
jgi:hypothetical protein